MQYSGDIEILDSDYDIYISDDNALAEESKTSICEDESSGDESEPDTRQSEVISCLENLALSFLSQLTASLTPVPRRDSSNSQLETSQLPKKIVLELVNRAKPQGSDKGKVDSTADTKLRSIQFPRKGKSSSAKSPAQVLRVANEAHEALLNEAPVTKRDLFYRDVPLFKSQAIVDALVDDLAATFSVNRSDLNIRASSKGLFCGSTLSIHLCDGTTVIGHDTEPSLIPHAQDIVEFEINEDINWILVVEKDAVFQTLRRAGLTTHPDLSGRGLLVTGKGYPDLATRQLVKTFSDNMPESTRILALVDADAYGLDIVSVYKYGSAGMRHENEKLAAERVEWIGVSAMEALKMGLDRDALLPITIHDQRKAISLLLSNSDLPSSWKRELMQILHTRRKAELEVLHSLPTMPFFSVDEGQVAVPACNSRKPWNPLVRFVIWKINNALRL